MGKATLTDEQLGVLVDRKAADSINWYNSKLSQERENVMKYYNGELPRRTSNGSSSFVSTDVYDGVESMKAQLLETFSAGNRIVKFDPTTAEDIEASHIATVYTDYVVFKQNDAYRMFGEVIDDGLKCRVGVVKVWWDDCVETSDHEFSDCSEEECQAMAQHEETDTFDASETEPGSGVFSGKLTRKLDKSQVRFEVVNPEEFAVESQAKGLTRETYCVQRYIKSIAELIKQGYDAEELREWNYADDTILKENPEVLARFQALDSGFSNSDRNDENDDMRRVLITESYIMAALEGDSEPKLYKIVRLGDKTLEKQEVEDLPYLAFVPLPVPHSFYGNSFAGRIISAQNARTVLTRSILDHTAITTNPRLQVLKGGVVNPKELLDNRLGGIVNTTRPDAILPLPQAPLNPFVFQTLEIIKTHNEESMGMSALSQGLNKDAVSKQNSGAMVEQLVSLGQTRQKVIARNFAEGFLIPLFIKVYNLVLVKEKRRKIVQVAGKWSEVDVTRWKERRAASVSLHLGYGDMEREAATRLQIGTMIAQDPALNRSFTPDGRFKFAKDVCDLKGINNFLDYMTPPDKLPPQQPDPIRMKELELEERKIAALEKTAQAQSDKVEAHVLIEQMRQQMAQMNDKFNEMVMLREVDRKDSEAANKIDVAQRETAILEDTPMTTGVASASPR